MQISGYSIVSGELSSGIRISKKSSARSSYVRFWPLADVRKDAFNVAFGGKADIEVKGFYFHF
jgi:hypothetical protein